MNCHKRSAEEIQKERNKKRFTNSLQTYLSNLISNQNNNNNSLFVLQSEHVHIEKLQKENENLSNILINARSKMPVSREPLIEKINAYHFKLTYLKLGELCANLEIMLPSLIELLIEEKIQLIKMLKLNEQSQDRHFENKFSKPSDNPVVIRTVIDLQSSSKVIPERLCPDQAVEVQDDVPNQLCPDEPVVAPSQSCPDKAVGIPVNETDETVSPSLLNFIADQLCTDELTPFEKALLESHSMPEFEQKLSSSKGTTFFKNQIKPGKNTLDDVVVNTEEKEQSKRISS